MTQVFSTTTDTLVSLGLAGTLFFSVPSAEARGNVALYLLLTVAPFAVIGPTLGRVLDRMPAATRAVLVAAAIGRGVLALALVGRTDSWWLFPAAFGLLVLSRVHGITRNSLLPIALDEPRALVAANARLAWIGMLAGAIAAGIGVLGLWLLDANGPLAVAGLSGLAAAWVGLRLPEPDAGADQPHRPASSRRGRQRLEVPRRVRLAGLATAGVRVFNGFLLLLLAFELHDTDMPLLDFGALLGAAGGGYAIASRLVPALERRVREELMVVAALALTAGAAFAAAQWFGLVAATALAATAGIAWGVAKLAFDGLLQSCVDTERRGAAFTRSETVFSIAWVLGAIIPTALPLPASLGLVLVGFGALTAQIVTVGALLLPTEQVIEGHGRLEPAPHPTAPDGQTPPASQPPGGHADGEPAIHDAETHPGAQPFASPPTATPPTPPSASEPPPHAEGVRPAPRPHWRWHPPR